MDCADKRNTYIVLNILLSTVLTLLFVHWANYEINNKWHPQRKQCSTSYASVLAFCGCNLILLPIFWNCKLALLAGIVSSAMVFYITTNEEAMNMYTSLNNKTDICSTFGKWFSGTGLSFGIASVILVIGFVTLRYLMTKDIIASQIGMPKQAFY